MLRKSVVWVVCLIVVAVLCLPPGGAEWLAVQAQEPPGEEEAFSPPIMVSTQGRRSKPRSRPPESDQEVSAQERIEDDEVAVIVGNTVSVWDPNPIDPKTPVSYQVTEGLGWRDIATGDFDGNGDQEIVVIDDYARVKVYNPGGPALGFTFDKTYAALGRYWIRVVTGETDNDGRDEIIVISNPVNDSSLLYVIDPRDGTETSAGTFVGGIWYYIAAGQILGDGRAEIALAEYYEDDSQAYFYLWDPANPLTTIYGRQGGGRNLGVVAGDMDKDGRDEVVMTRSGDHDPSLLGFDYYVLENRIAALDLGFNFPGWGDVSDDEENPGWGYIDLGDVTGNGDDELVGIRGLPSGVEEDFENLMVKDPYVQPDEINASEGYYFVPPTVWEGVKLLDYDGDGKKEVVFRKDRYVVGYDWVAPGGDIEMWGSKRFAGDLSGMAVGDFETPVLQVNPAQIIFFMNKNDKNVVPAWQIVQVNVSSGDFTWRAQYSSDISWFNVIPNSGSDPSTAAVIVDKTVVPTDTARSYSGLITISTYDQVYGSPQQIDVTLIVTGNILNTYVPYLPNVSQ